MSKYLIDEIGRTRNIDVQYQTQVLEVHGEERLEAITLACLRSGSRERIDARAMFVFIGAQPRTEWLKDFVDRDARGFIMTGPDLLHDGKPPKYWPMERDPGLLETSLPGVFAVGDVRHGSVKRVASGVGEGSIAIQFVHQYLSKV